MSALLSVACEGNDGQRAPIAEIGDYRAPSLEADSGVDGPEVRAAQDGTLVAQTGPTSAGETHGSQGEAAGGTPAPALASPVDEMDAGGSSQAPVGGDLESAIAGGVKPGTPLVKEGDDPGSTGEASTSRPNGAHAPPPAPVDQGTVRAADAEPVPVSESVGGSPEDRARFEANMEAWAKAKLEREARLELIRANRDSYETHKPPTGKLGGG